MSHRSPSLIGRRRTGNLWLQTDAGEVPAHAIDFVGTGWASDSMLGLPNWIDLPLLGDVDVRLPAWLARRIPHRFARLGYYTIVIEHAGHLYTTTPWCDTEDEAEAVKHTLLVALYRHRNAAGVLMHNMDGWTVKPFTSESTPEHDGDASPAAAAASR